MKTFSSAALLLFLLATLGGAEPRPVSGTAAAEQWQTTSESGPHLPAPSRLEELLNTVGSRVVTQKTAGQWDSDQAHATFTALEVYHGALDRTERGLRIEMSRPGTNAVVYVDESVFPALHRVMEYYTAHLPQAADVSVQNPSGGRLSWLFDPPRRVVHLLNTGVYFDTAAKTPGFFLGRAFKTPNSSNDFKFPGTLPSAFDKVLDDAAASFRRQSP
jgi:hypothetical protein